MKIQEILNAQRNIDTHEHRQAHKHTQGHTQTHTNTHTRTHAHKNPGTLPVFKAWLAGLP
jgi:hypothetical protein